MPGMKSSPSSVFKPSFSWVNNFSSKCACGLLPWRLVEYGGHSVGMRLLVRRNGSLVDPSGRPGIGLWLSVGLGSLNH